MAIVLQSKPGLSSTTTLNIPAEWSATWFRNLINNQLKGADVRNAVGANGISVTGTIASPYATISIASSGPIVTSGPVTIGPPPAGSIALAVIGNGVQNAVGITGNGSISPLVLQGDNADGYGIIFQGGATGSIEYGGIGPGSRNVTGAPLASMCVWAFGGPVILGGFNGSYIALEVDGTGSQPAVTINSNNNSTGLVINGASGNYTTQVAAPGTTGQSNGLLVTAGTNTSDICAIFESAAGGQFGIIRGNGGWIIGSTGTNEGAGTLNVQNGYWSGYATYLMSSTAAWTNGAGTTSPTLGATGPAGATTPTKWIAVNDNGTVRHIPAW